MTPSERPAVWTGHVVAYARDLMAVAAFYEAIGMRPVATLPDLAVLELRGGTHLVLHHDEHHVSAPLDFDLMVEDLEATHAEWSAAGIVVSPIEDVKIHTKFTVQRSRGQHDHRVQHPRRGPGLIRS